MSVKKKYNVYVAFTCPLCLSEIKEDVENKRIETDTATLSTGEIVTQEITRIALKCDVCGCKMVSGVDSIKRAELDDVEIQKDTRKAKYEIIACPHCEGKATIYKDAYNKEYFVYCDCGIETDSYTTKTAALKAFNEGNTTNTKESEV